nr:MAG TPA: hypothetical protein [Caudoviricetes sp.]
MIMWTLILTIAAIVLIDLVVAAIVHINSGDDDDQ